MKTIDLFAGAGGLSCGLRQSGFDTVFANEWVAEYANTYQANHPNTQMWVGDVRDVCALNLKKRLGLKTGELALIAGGPPCQGFSVNAPIRSLDDARNHLFKDFLRIVGTLLPKAVLIENVPGIVSLGQGTVVQQIYHVLTGLGYKVKHKILFAGHYGVPQMRFRTVFIGIKDYAGDIRFPEPTYDAKAVANFAGAQALCLPLPAKPL
ncbi:MAG: DNA cytosine methyltransferase, partial [Candidatus Methylumidiphilus sp.]